MRSSGIPWSSSLSYYALRCAAPSPESGALAASRHRTRCRRRLVGPTIADSFAELIALAVGWPDLRPVDTASTWASVREHVEQLRTYTTRAGGPSKVRRQKGEPVSTMVKPWRRATRYSSVRTRPRQRASETTRRKQDVSSASRSLRSDSSASGRKRTSLTQVTDCRYYRFQRK